MGPIPHRELRLRTEPRAKVIEAVDTNNAEHSQPSQERRATVNPPVVVERRTRVEQPRRGLRRERSATTSAALNRHSRALKQKGSTYRCANKVIGCQDRSTIFGIAEQNIEKKALDRDEIGRDVDAHPD